MIYDRPSMSTFRIAQPSQYARLFGIRLLIVIGAGLALYGQFVSFHIRVPLLQTLALTPFIVAIGNSPFSPGGIGTTQLVFTLAFARFAAKDDLFALSLAVTVFNLVVRMPMGLAMGAPLAAEAVKSKPNLFPRARLHNYESHPQQLPGRTAGDRAPDWSVCRLMPRTINRRAQIVDRVAHLFGSKSSIATVKMQITNEDCQRNISMKIWSLGDKILVRIRNPPDQAGTAILKVGSNIWYYLPKTNRTVKLPGVDDDDPVDGQRLHPRRPGERELSHARLRDRDLL